MAVQVAQGSLFEPQSVSVPVPADRLLDLNVSQWPVAPGWRPVVDRFFAGAAGQRLLQALQQRLDAGAMIFPPQPLRALTYTAPEQVRVVIVGQDPYHGAGQAEGLAFSVAPGCRIPPSLRNIFKELQRDLGQTAPGHGSLQTWAQRGVLLLNTCLTVEEGQPASHAKLGWESLTDALLHQVASSAAHCVYLLWGAHAQAKRTLIEQGAQACQRQALVLIANHPSPLAALRPPMPFMGCGHFSMARDWLAGHGVQQDWGLPVD